MSRQITPHLGRSQRTSLLLNDAGRKGFIRKAPKALLWLAPSQCFQKTEREMIPFGPFLELCPHCCYLAPQDMSLLVLFYHPFWPHYQGWWLSLEYCYLWWNYEQLRRAEEKEELGEDKEDWGGEPCKSSQQNLWSKAQWRLTRYSWKQRQNKRHRSKRRCMKNAWNGDWQARGLCSTHDAAYDQLFYFGLH